MSTWREVRIDDLELSVRTVSCLRNASIETLGDLLRPEWDEYRLLRLPNFGKKSLSELRAVVEYMGAKLGTDQPLPPPPPPPVVVPRKIVTLLSNGLSLIALADDNTVWTLRENGHWYQLASLPGRQILTKDESI